MKNFVINVKERFDRLDQFFKLNASFDKSLFDIVEATTPADFEKNTALISKFFNSPETYSDTAIAVALSHVRLWQICIKSNEAVTVIEDDAVLQPNFFEIRNRLIAENEFDFLALGFNTDWPVEVDFGAGIPKTTFIFSRESSDLQKPSPASPTLVKADCFAGIPCYVITPQGAKKLIQHIFPIKKSAYLLREANSFIVPNFRKMNWWNSGIDVDIAINLKHLNAKLTLPPIAVPQNDWENSSFERNGHQVYWHTL